jgi:carbonic anhydrase/acetyltransferase-like protein (isoleucine patch superfamily)
MYNLLPIMIISSIWMTSSIAALVPLLSLSPRSSIVAHLLAVGIAPIIFSVVFPIIAGLISLPFQRGIVSGRFPREPYHKVYFCRRVFGGCWAQLFYFKPVYSFVLAIPIFRSFVFWLFGYRGSPDFTVYPDTWIRDLPVLKISEGAYLANRATIGTNIVLTDGSILVETIRIRRKALIGHLCIIGTGSTIGESAEIGLRSSIGIRTRIGDKANIKPSTSISHGTTIGEGTIVGTMSYVGTKCYVGAGVKLPAGSVIPDGAVVNTQEEADTYFSSEKSTLVAHRNELLNKLLDGYNGGRQS